jgi:hypothetical protein
MFKALDLGFKKFELLGTLIIFLILFILSYYIKEALIVFGSFIGIVILYWVIVGIIKIPLAFSKTLRKIKRDTLIWDFIILNGIFLAIEGILIAWAVSLTTGLTSLVNPVTDPAIFLYLYPIIYLVISVFSKITAKMSLINSIYFFCATMLLGFINMMSNTGKMEPAGIFVVSIGLFVPFQNIAEDFLDIKSNEFKSKRRRLKANKK